MRTRVRKSIEAVIGHSADEMKIGLKLRAMARPKLKECPAWLPLEKFYTSVVGSKAVSVVRGN